MRKMSRVAIRRSPAEIEEIAWQARASLGLRPYDRVPVAKILEHNLPELMPDFVLKVAETGVLGLAEAVAHQSRPEITLSEATYAGLYRDEARPRMTCVHELGHLLLHTGQYALAFTTKYDARIDPEKQADLFAGAFMMPEAAFRKVTSIEDAMKKFGVSRGAASFRARELKMFWLIENRPPPRRKKGHGKRRTP